MISPILLEDETVIERYINSLWCKSMWNLVIRQKKLLIKVKHFIISLLKQWEIDDAFNINGMSGHSSLDS